MRGQEAQIEHHSLGSKQHVRLEPNLLKKEFNMYFELDAYRENLDQRFVNENLTPVNDGEQIKIFHASVWVDALLKNPYSGEVYWGFVR